MAGVRVQHPTERNVTYLIVDSRRPYHQPVACPVCATLHVFKTYHISLDETGAAIVSPEIVEKLKQIHGHGIAVANEVAKPPAQSVGLVAARPKPRIVQAQES